MAFELKGSPGEIMYGPQEEADTINCGFLLESTIFTELVPCEKDKPHDPAVVLHAMRRFKVNTGRTPKIIHISETDMAARDASNADIE